MASTKNKTYIPTLSSMCVKVIGTKIDKIDPILLQALSEYEWESVVRFKCETISKSKSNASKRKMSGNYGKLPAINEKVVKEIEEKNPHLRSSKVVDELIWQDCVEYHFARDGNSRPTILYLPWPKLVETYEKLGIAMLDLLKKPCTSKAEDSLNRTRKLEKCITRLYIAPMCVPLLAQSRIGKNVADFVKQSRKIFPKGKNLEDCEVPDHFPSLCSERWPLQPNVIALHSDRHSATQKSSELSSSLAALEKLLLGWKGMAKKAGIKMKNSSENQRPQDLSNSCTGQDSVTSGKQHKQDIADAQKCNEWRELHVLLLKRKQIMTASNSARYKKILDNECSNKLTTAKTSTKKKTGWDRGQIPPRVSGSKLKDMRQGLKDANRVMKSMGTRGLTKETSAFGAAVASVKINKNKKPQWDGQTRGLKRGSGLIFGNGVSKRDIAMTGGRKLKLPRSSKNS